MRALKYGRFVILAILTTGSCVMPGFAQAEDMRRDDTISFNISAEDWISTKTAQVTLHVEAAVPASESGTVRTRMNKAVDGIATADWHLVGFAQQADQAGMQDWTASFVARLPESALGDLAESARKTSKPGLQISVADVEFSPTLDEVEGGRDALRLKLMQEALNEATALGKASARNYRIAHLNFSDMDVAPMAPRPMMHKMMAATDASQSSSEAPQRANRAVMHAEVTLAAEAPAQVIPTATH